MQHQDKLNDRDIGERFVTVDEACRIAGGISPVTLWREERAGRFPKRRRITARRVGWLESEISAWIKSRAQQVAGG